MPKPLLLFVFALLCINLCAVAQKKRRPISTAEITPGTYMPIEEVTIKDWINFIVDNDFDTTLFPADEGLSNSAKLVFNDLKKGRDFKYIKLVNNNIAALATGKTVVKPTKKFDDLVNSDTNFFSLIVPITGISFTQAQRFCKWKEYIFRKLYHGHRLTVELPSKEVYAIVITNIDSLCTQHCDSCEQYTLNSISAKCNAQIKNKAIRSQGVCLSRVDAHWPNKYGLYNIQGNAAEMTSTAGIAMGGSFRHYARQSYKDEQQQYTGPADWLGFRYVIRFN